MQFVARAPGKLVVLGEYAVLDGAPALAIAVDRHCRASIGPSADTDCHLETRAPAPARISRAPGEPTGVALVDLVCAQTGGLQRIKPWRAVLDSADLFCAGDKLGLGSSAAALCAWAGVWAAYAGAAGLSACELDVECLVRMHRAFQRGAGSGLDVAASLTGGAIEFRLHSEARPNVSTVRLPNSVGLACIFTGSAASTPSLVAHYREWATQVPKAADRQRQAMTTVAENGCAAARNDDAEGFLEAVSDYGRCLDALGKAMGADIVTAEHREIETTSKQHGVAYKVSGAGGGDLGIAFSSEPDALHALRSSVRLMGYRVVDLHLDRDGLVVEERTE
ncbi:mevalonate kinase family protein [Candidatus Rariloculus sp.]|uniref:mevalonate kinase family protein n=1 Tax=Candidatus Rariloculus sp. TaxID=3101265 RepID=UPI003D0FFF7C